jgi:23S rRNA (adenine2503-C2)-methyltransferase
MPVPTDSATLPPQERSGIGNAGDRPALPAPKPLAADGKPNLIGLDQTTLQAVIDALEPASERQSALRARQLFHWLYHRGADDFVQMTTLPKALRERLAEGYSIARPTVTAMQTAGDGTRKWLLRFADGQEVETVFIPEEDRGALCISTQVGCTLSCSFCHTGTMPLVRNLGAAEITAQILVARDALGEWPTAAEERLFTNIVVMGMGEPLFNYDNIAAALRLAMDETGLAMSRRRITLSTSGVVPRIAQCGAELGVGLAISLHAVRDELRDRLVPLNRKWNIATLLEACRDYPTRRPITFEYVMLKGVNDSDAEARELVRLLDGIPAKVNLIPFNPWPGAAYECSSNNRIRAFAAIVEAAGYASPVRLPRGRDILAACGQLKTASERQRRQRTAA